MSAVDLSVQLGRLRLKNPIATASGTFGYGLEFAGFVDLGALGAISVKGLSARPCLGIQDATRLEDWIMSTHEV